VGSVRGQGFSYRLIVFSLPLVAEYLIMKAGTMGLNLTYSDTMGDLALSFGGGVVGATLASLLANRRTAAQLTAAATA
jgi:hypothetical protein